MKNNRTTSLKDQVTLSDVRVEDKKITETLQSL